MYLYAFFPRHTYKTKLHFYILKALKLTRHILRDFYILQPFMMIYDISIHVRKHIKKIVCMFVWQKHYEIKQTRREFNKIARKCKWIVSLMVNLSVIPSKKSKE